MVYNKEYLIGELIDHFNDFKGCNLVSTIDNIADKLSANMYPRLGRVDYGRYDIKSDIMLTYFANEEEIIEKLKNELGIEIESMYDKFE